MFGSLIGIGIFAAMLYPNTYKIFEDYINSSPRTYLHVCSNGTNCILDGKVSEVSEVRRNFKLLADEEIMMFRDMSFCNANNLGVVVTDWGITTVRDKEKLDGIKKISWKDVHHVEIESNQLLFFFSEDRNDYTRIHLYRFLNNDSPFYSNASAVLASLFTKMAQSQPKEEAARETAIAKWRKLGKAGKHKEALQVLLQFRSDFNSCHMTATIARDLVLFLNEYDRALKILDEDIRKLSDEQIESKATLTWWKIKVLLYKEENRLLSLDKSGAELKKAQEHNFDYILAKHREECLFVAQNAPEDKTGNLLFEDSKGEKVKIKDDGANDLRTAENYIQEHFLEKPYKERKLIVPVDEYTTLDQKTLTAINIDRLGKIDFPMGHPVVNHLYVGHPLIPSKYIPFENYELELIEDRVREFGVLAQSLGATSITIECINANGNKGNQHVHTNVNGNVSYGVASGNGSYDNDANSRFITEISQKISLHQEFSPKEAPHVPDGLVWYSSEPSWQRLVEQRMKGSLKIHEERIETRKSQVVENSELKKISAEVKALFMATSGSWEKSMERMFESHENAILAIHVEFAPIESLGIKNQSPQTAQNPQHLSADEQDYVDELRECLGKDGKISDGERRLLNKFRIRLGISEIRAQELEKSLVKPQLQLTADEQEYLSEYKEAMEEGGLSALSRRLLNKLRNSMGISDERAKEIENSII